MRALSLCVFRLSTSSARCVSAVSPSSGSGTSARSGTPRSSRLDSDGSWAMQSMQACGGCTPSRQALEGEGRVRAGGRFLRRGHVEGQRGIKPAVNEACRAATSRLDRGTSVCCVRLSNVAPTNSSYRTRYVNDHQSVGWLTWMCMRMPASMVRLRRLARDASPR